MARAMAAAAMAAVAAAANGAAAQSPGTTLGFAPLPPNPRPTLGLIDEVKAGVLAHDIGFLGDSIERGPDVNIELLFTSPDILSVIGSPRPHLGGDINTDRNTSDGYFGLTWGISLIQNLFAPGDYLFATGSLGGAYQDGFIDNAPFGRKRLGSPVLFRESAELGFQVTPTISVSAILDHISNANLGKHNAGITSGGARVGFKF
ncbi:MAG: acyloxyacyl hydrolase [Alphaproteobacteria bacterium]|nr:acyloxyacyl hydrolase [Alphaproteobacteria bacterium]